jgi:hypothetical protein
MSIKVATKIELRRELALAAGRRTLVFSACRPGAVPRHPRWLAHAVRVHRLTAAGGTFAAHLQQINRMC